MACQQEYYATWQGGGEAHASEQYGGYDQAQQEWDQSESYGQENAYDQASYQQEADPNQWVEYQSAQPQEPAQLEPPAASQHAVDSTAQTAVASQDYYPDPSTTTQQLSFTAGTTVYLSDGYCGDADEWWYGTLEDGSTGYFPQYAVMAAPQAPVQQLVAVPSPAYSTAHNAADAAQDVRQEAMKLRPLGTGPPPCAAPVSMASTGSGDAKKGVKNRASSVFERIKRTGSSFMKRIKEKRRGSIDASAAAEAPKRERKRTMSFSFSRKRQNVPQAHSPQPNASQPSLANTAHQQQMELLAQMLSQSQ